MSSLSVLRGCPSRWYDLGTTVPVRGEPKTAAGNGEGLKNGEGGGEGGATNGSACSAG